MILFAGMKFIRIQYRSNHELDFNYFKILSEMILILYMS